METLIINNINR